MKKAGFDKDSLNIVATLNRKNFHVMDEFEQFAEQLSVSMNLSLFSPVGRGKGQEDLQLTTEQYCRFIFSLNTKGKNQVQGETKSAGTGCDNCSKITPSLKNTCGVVQSSLGIKYNGDLVPCHLFFASKDPKMNIGNILDKQIEDKLWDFFLDYIPTVDEKKDCTDCNVRYFCGGSCYAPGYNQDGTFKSAHPSCDRYKLYYSTLVESLGYTDEFAVFEEKLSKRLDQLADVNAVNG